VTIE
jgi:ABC-type transport system involved in cytochrome c biogenesis ATPase subunit